MSVYDQGTTGRRGRQIAYQSVRRYFKPPQTSSPTLCGHHNNKAFSTHMSVYIVWRHLPAVGSFGCGLDQGLVENYFLFVQFCGWNACHHFAQLFINGFCYMVAIVAFDPSNCFFHTTVWINLEFNLFNASSRTVQESCRRRCSTYQGRSWREGRRRVDQNTDYDRDQEREVHFKEMYTHTTTTSSPTATSCQQCKRTEEAVLFSRDDVNR